ncbi:guanylate-binding protein 1 [Ricinus communis]|uniref:Interferon-induced guanylate-binding protein, putative n=1 Tax=Ricinus communis TaxID=3988 RepID=B9RB86_RICCO|nr:guanylate-binding protein 1 [Ricinus communis]EEF50807.1 interferon-induced guanylate-binding protein, putative [Ricinus communis]|eukprot:XP_002509420.1 guanylate-binding protein 1 [Ricinus communis]
MFKIFRGRDTASESSPETSPYQSPSMSQTSSTGPARPIRLVYCDEKGKFRMDPEAVATLQLVKGPIGVVSVCGRARQGKSFILNQLLGRSTGFQVASTHRPCTKGLWLWSAPLKRTALDGTEYNLLLLDTEGIDAYDQTGTYSTQIFTLAVLLSSMFIFNQMGGIDESSIDQLSLVTQLTKHIRVKASGGRTTVSELGQFSPIFVWLLRDFYLDLVEDNKKITPRDYLEIALRPVQGSGGDIAAKNAIRDSIRALFPDRECFALVRPVPEERDLQRMGQLSLDNLRPEFRSGLDALTKFVFERTRPKQVGATIMTGPVLVGITESYLEALNNGAVPTICSSWQSVEEAECRKAYDIAMEVYRSTFNRSKLPEEVALREAHEEAVRKSLDAFNASAVGIGETRKKYEGLLHKELKKAFEDYKRITFMEADLRCSNAIQKMERKLRTACHSSDANVDNIVKLLDGFLSDYETSCHGPGKWQKLAIFLQQSLEGPICDLAKRLNDQIGSEKSSLMLKCRSIEDKMTLLNKQLEASEKHKSEYMQRYNEAINEKKKLADDYMKRISDMQSSRSLLDERCSSLVKALESAKQEMSDWKRKHDQLLSKQKADEDQTSSEIAVLKSRSSATEARLAAAHEQTKSAQEEAAEWKRKYDITVRETKAALEKAAIVQERTGKETQLREDALREEFYSQLAEKEREIKEKNGRIEHAEQCLTTLNLELKAAESKMKSFDSEISSLKLEIKEWSEKFESANAKAQSYEREARILEQEKIHLEQKYGSEFERFAEVQDRCHHAENECKRATELADKARADAASAQREKSELQKLAMERLAQIERAKRHIESLEREKNDLADEVDRIRITEMEAVSRVALLEARVEEREKEIELLLKSNNEERASNVKALKELLDAERKAHSVANKRAEDFSLQLEEARAKLDALQQEFTSVRLNESALDNKLKATSHGKRLRSDDVEMGVGSVQDMGTNNRSLRQSKKSRSTSSPLKYTHPEDGGSVFMGDEDNQSQQTDQEDYTKFTVQKLKQELTKHNFGAELLQLKTPNKKDILALYEKCVLQKS